jgi:flagellar assembly protein FliH
MSSSSFSPLFSGEAPAGRSFRPLGEGEPAPTPASGGPAPGGAPGRPDTTEEARRAFQAGYELGREEVQSQVESIAESFVKSLEELAQFRTRLRERYERELLELALGVARKVVQQELADRPEIWLTMIRSAVHRAVDRERISLRVPPALAAFLTERLPTLRAALADVKEVAVVEDPSLPEHGCVIESRFGEIDIGVETQLDAAERALVGAEE